MIKLENTDVYGWEAAIRGMRNPMNSWDKSDSGVQEIYGIGYEFVIGENDLRLMKNLSKAGNDHGKFLRMITVTVDITAPLYWWKEFDTYKVGTVANSCSTMHKIHAKEFTVDDFSHEHLDGIDDQRIGLCFGSKKPQATLDSSSMGCLEITVAILNCYRNKYLEAKTKPMKEEAKRPKIMKHYWWQMIQLLPSSYNQKRTVQLNYQVLKQMYFARRNHKLDEWYTLCEWCESLPYFKEICLNVE